MKKVFFFFLIDNICINNKGFFLTKTIEIELDSSAQRVSLRFFHQCELLKKLCVNHRLDILKLGSPCQKLKNKYIKIVDV